MKKRKSHNKNIANLEHDKSIVKILNKSVNSTFIGFFALLITLFLVLFGHDAYYGYFENSYGYLCVVLLSITGVIYTKKIIFNIKRLFLSFIFLSIGYINLILFQEWEIAFMYISMSVFSTVLLYEKKPANLLLFFSILQTGIIIFLVMLNSFPHADIELYNSYIQEIKGFEILFIFIVIISSSIGYRKLSQSMFETQNNLYHANMELIQEILTSKTIKKMLEEEKERLLSLFEQSFSSILLIEDQKIISCNKKSIELFECSESELIGKMPFELSPILQANGISSEKQSKSFIIQALDDRPKTFEWKFRSFKGKEFITEVSLSKIIFNKKPHLQCIIQDITDRKETEIVLEKYRDYLEEQVKSRTEELINTNEELKITNERLNGTNSMLIEEIKVRKETQSLLEEHNKMKDKLISVIGHDLRNPFNNILSFSTLIAQRAQLHNDEKIYSFANHINISAENGYTLLENLLNWARNQIGHIEFSPRPITSSEIIKNTLSFHHTGAIKKNITINVDSSDLHIVFADERMLETILRNLISNAIKFTPQNGLINISSKKIKNYIVLSVQDNGVGMSKEMLDNLFTSKNVESKHGTEGEKGTGLGLSLCKEFATRNHGELLIESEENKGSVFKVRLPLYEKLEPTHN